MSRDGDADGDEELMIIAVVNVSVCETLDCEHFTVIDDDGRCYCQCKQRYSLQLDRRHCDGICTVVL